MASARGTASSNGPDFIPRPTFAAQSAFAVPSDVASPSLARLSGFAVPSSAAPSSLAGPSRFATGAASFLAFDPFFDTPGSFRSPSGLFPGNPPSRPPATEARPQFRTYPRNETRRQGQFIAGPSAPVMASSALLVRPEVWGDTNPERGNRPPRRTRDQFEEDDAIGSDDGEETKIAEERRERHRQRFMIRRPPSTLSDSSMLTVHEPSWTIRPSSSRFGTTLGFSPRTTPARSLASTQPCDWDESDDADAEIGFGRTAIPPARSHIPTPRSEANFRARPQAPTITTTLDRDEFVCAISESRSSDVIGVAVVNITTGQANITRILNDDKYQRLADTLSLIEHQPRCFLVLKSVSDKTSKSLLVPCLEVEFPNVPIVPVVRAHWNESEGLALVETLALRNQVKALRACLDNNFYVSCAFCAVCLRHLAF